MEEHNSSVEIEDNVDVPEPGIAISDTALAYLKETSKWTKFLAVLGLIFVGIITIAAFFVGKIFSSIPVAGLDGITSGFAYLFTFIYLVIGLVYFFPSWYLFKFSSQLKTALTNKDSDALDEAFSNHKSFYKFFGVFTIVFLSIYVVFGLIGLLGVLSQYFFY
mgnify:CR=1 FL=1